MDTTKLNETQKREIVKECIIFLFKNFFTILKTWILKLFFKCYKN